MAVCQTRSVDATVDCTVRVARDAAGTLADGAANQLDRVDGVEAVDDVAVAGIEPRLNDVAVDVEAVVSVAVSADEAGTDADEARATATDADAAAVDAGVTAVDADAAAVAATIDDGFGVDVEGVRVES